MEADVQGFVVHQTFICGDDVQEFIKAEGLRSLENQRVQVEGGWQEAKGWKAPTVEEFSVAARVQGMRIPRDAVVLKEETVGDQRTGYNGKIISWYNPHETPPHLGHEASWENK